MIPRDFFFSHLANFWHLFWLIPLMALLIYASYQRKKVAEKLVEPSLQPAVLIPRDAFWNSLSLLCFALGWVCAIFALMGPIGNEYYLEDGAKYKGEHAPLELFLVIDTSQSMAVTDGRNKKMRLESATEIADRLVFQVKNDPVALFAFTSELVPFVPLTYDRTFVRLMLKELQLNEGDHYGTNLSIVFEQLKNQLFEMYPKAPKAVVLFSDGGDLSIEASSGNDRIKAIQSLVAIAKGLNVPVYAVGIGSIEGGEVPGIGNKITSRLDENLLSEISKQTGGRYFSGNTQSADEVAARINQSLEKPRTSENTDGVVASSKALFRIYFQVPLALALIFFGLSFFMPKVSRKFLVLLIMIPLNGFSVDPGESLYEAGQFKEAANWFSGELKHLPPEWLRNKLLYNLGTSLMAEKKWKEASDAFFAVSKEAYTYPLFRLRLLYNQIVALHHQGIDVRPLIQLIDIKELNALKIEEPKVKSDPLDQAIRLYRLAALLDKPAPSLPSAITLDEKNLDEATFYLIQLKLNQTLTPSVFLESSLNQLAVAYALPNGHERVAKNASRFYSLVLEWQKARFKEGKCQCNPWNEVMPLFTDGLRMLEQKPFEKQIFYTYNKWLEALQMMHAEQSPSKEEEKPEENDIRELREMQTLDKQQSKPKMKPVGGMPW